MSQHIPLEIYCLIAEQLQSSAGPSKDKLAKKTLMAMRLASKQMCSAATPFLFSHVEALPAIDDCVSVATCQLGGGVRSLSIHFSKDAFGDQEKETESNRVRARKSFQSKLRKVVRNLPALRDLSVETRSQMHSGRDLLMQDKVEVGSSSSSF